MAEQLQAGVLPDGAVFEWHPSRGTLLAWAILGSLLAMVACAAYMLVALRGSIPSEWSISVLTVALCAGLGCVHEAIHGIAALAFGASPQFGVLKIGGIPAGFYTTAPGHRFSRRQYLILCLAPLAVLTPVGIPACLLPFGAYLAFPFAVAFGGCIGDITIAWHVLRAPSDVLVEDLRDGMRFWKADA